jgi:PAS domain-containing protein
VRAVKFDDGLAQTWRDVTEHVDAGEALAKSEARLRAVVDAMVDPQLLSEPIRDADGRIIDFLIEDANLRAWRPIPASHSPRSRAAPWAPRSRNSWPKDSWRGMPRLPRPVSQPSWTTSPFRTPVTG